MSSIGGVRGNEGLSVMASVWHLLGVNDETCIIKCIFCPGDMNGPVSPVKQ